MKCKEYENEAIPRCCQDLIKVSFGGMCIKIAWNDEIVAKRRDDLSVK